MLWQPDWTLTPEEIYEAKHSEIIARDRWIVDGLGRKESIPKRLQRATHIVLIDMPLWMHFWLAAERQISWATGAIEHAPGGISRMPPTEALFQNIWDVEQNWMPEIRSLCVIEQVNGKAVTKIESVSQLTKFTENELAGGWSNVRS